MTSPSTSWSSVFRDGDATTTEATLLLIQTASVKIAMTKASWGSLRPVLSVTSWAEKRRDCVHGKFVYILKCLYLHCITMHESVFVSRNVHTTHSGIVCGVCVWMKGSSCVAMSNMSGNSPNTIKPYTCIHLESHKMDYLEFPKLPLKPLTKLFAVVASSLSNTCIVNLGLR